MKVQVRKIKYKLNLNDGTVEKRWTHIPDDWSPMFVEWPEKDDPEREDKFNNIRFDVITLCLDYAPQNFKGKVQPILDGTSCWDWAGMVDDVDYKFYDI